MGTKNTWGERKVVQRNRIRSTIRLSISLLLALLIAHDFAALPAAAADTASAQTPTQLSARGTLVGRTNAQKALTLAVALKVQDEAGLDTLLHNLYDPTSSHYRQYLTLQQFTDQFISTTSRKQLTDYLRKQGTRMHTINNVGSDMMIKVK